MSLGTLLTTARLNRHIRRFFGRDGLGSRRRRRNGQSLTRFPVARRCRVETNDGAVRIATSEAKQVEFRVIYEGLTS